MEPLEIVLYIVFFLTGLVMGSFLEVASFRIPRKISIIRPRSKSISLMQSMTSLTTTTISEQKALSLLLITTEEMKIYLNRPSLIEDTTKRDGLLLLVGSSPDPMDLTKNING